MTEEPTTGGGTPGGSTKPSLSSKGVSPGDGAAMTAAVNNLIKRVKRAAFGFKSFRNYRIRSLFYAGKSDWSLLATVTPR